MEAAAGEEMQLDAVIDDFEMLQQVGSGTFCVVKLCRYKKNGRVYVVKILSKKKIVYLKQVVHVTQEVEILRKVQNPFIVTLYNTMQDEENLYMILEFACGGELFTHMSNQGH
jgi:serine/threonine protein kinase